MENKLGTKVDLFAYPNGQLTDFDRRTIKILKEHDYVAACSTVWGTRNNLRDMFNLNRIRIDSTDNLDIFKLKLSGGYDYIWFLHSLKGLWADKSNEDF